MGYIRESDIFINDIRKIGSLPYNGIKSIAIASLGFIILGDSIGGKLYILEEETLYLFYQSDNNEPISNIVLINDLQYMISLGGKIEIITLNIIPPSILDSSPFVRSGIGKLMKLDPVMVPNPSFYGVGTYGTGVFGGELMVARPVGILDYIKAKFIKKGGSVSIGKAIRILDLENEIITDMISIEDTGNIVIATSIGRIFSCSKELVIAYLTGNRTVYVDVHNGVGVSNSNSKDFIYALYKKAVEVNKDKEIEKWKFASNVVAITNKQVIGEFIGPIIHVKEDLGFWKQILWTEIKPNNTDIIINIRNGNSSEELLAAPWKLGFRSNMEEINPIIRELNKYTINGQYLQLKVKMITKTKDITPIMANVTMKYSTKQASYFFTTKFSFEKNSNPNSGLLIANITEPQNTEVRIGITSKNSSDWKDYQVISPDKLFELTDENMQNMKVGIKFISYDDVNIPEVAEFALFIGGEKIKILNK